MAAKPVQVVYGPGTFLNRAVAAVNSEVQTLMTLGPAGDQPAPSRSAYQLALGRPSQPGPGGRRRQRGRGSSSTSSRPTTWRSCASSRASPATPRIDDPQFISQIVFDQTRGVNQPKARFSYLFPTANSALIQVRLKSSLSDVQQAAGDLAGSARRCGMPMFRSAYGGTYTVSGEPVVVNDLASQPHRLDRAACWSPRCW